MFERMKAVAAELIAEGRNEAQVVESLKTAFPKAEEWQDAYEFALADAEEAAYEERREANNATGYEDLEAAADAREAQREYFN